MASLEQLQRTREVLHALSLDALRQRCISWAEWEVEARQYWGHLLRAVGPREFEAIKHLVLRGVRGDRR